MNPKKPVDPELIEKLASIMCTDEEIARIAKIGETTLKRRFRQQLNDGRAAGKMTLRRVQFESAKNGNVVAQIWLGKQWLGQRDRTEIETKTSTPDARLARMTDAELDAEIGRLESGRQGGSAAGTDGVGPAEDAPVPAVRLLAPGQ